MNPIYIDAKIEGDIERLLTEIPWQDHTETRQECFMSDPGGLTYTYGQGRGVRTYTSIPYTRFVEKQLSIVNEFLRILNYNEMNGCFLNCYLHERQHLGWHSDNFDKMDHSCPVVSLSFGEPREIWWRPIGSTGTVPLETRQLLASGSLFIMPPGMQFTHEHRIAKGDRSMGPRVSLTFRRFLME